MRAKCDCKSGRYQRRAVVRVPAVVACKVRWKFTRKRLGIVVFHLHIVLVVADATKRRRGALSGEDDLVVSLLREVLIPCMW